MKISAEISIFDKDGWLAWTAIAATRCMVNHQNAVNVMRTLCPMYPCPVHHIDMRDYKLRNVKPAISLLSQEWTELTNTMHMAAIYPAKFATLFHTKVAMAVTPP
jgi:hypothetical protein